MASCFIIMPLTTPEALVPAYGQDPDHFFHVLEHLFVPALKRAEFDPMRPIAQGADVIHAEIVKNLETADLVLCDISSLNPNVFFELGCRTALNKPVCYVMDDLTRGIPFDTGIINHHTYSHKLELWTLESDIKGLADHARASAERSAGKNMLWQYFGLQSVVHAAKSGDVGRDRLEYIALQVEAIRKDLERRPIASTGFASLGTGPYEGEWSNVKAEPVTYYSNYGGALNNFTPFVAKAVDWDEVIKNSESYLNQMEPLRKPNESRLDIKQVREIIEEHIKSLGELIESEPHSIRGTKARSLRARFEILLSAK